MCVSILVFPVLMQEAPDPGFVKARMSGAAPANLQCVAMAESRSRTPVKSNATAATGQPKICPGLITEMGFDCRGSPLGVFCQTY
jgi:hypothetical protein